LRFSRFPELHVKVLKCAISLPISIERAFQLLPRVGRAHWSSPWLGTLVRLLRRVLGLLGGLGHALGTRAADEKRMSGKKERRTEHLYGQTHSRAHLPL
jgi:hypothetical protein